MKIRIKEQSLNLKEAMNSETKQKISELLSKLKEIDPFINPGFITLKTKEEVMLIPLNYVNYYTNAE